ncbi:COG4315 family predicted lipoprotein [Kitasatospora sp. NBC_00458]|uniref:COG4315 family predicted lipoprotein n=1 Tax=Kitasatospora sp. NBC_00458 TaxID=2903568 RepID=UPI002E189054
MLAASGLAAAALVAGCGSSGGTPAGPAAPSTPSTAPTAPATPAPATTTLRTATDAKLGTVVTDGSGFTLYRFDRDGATPPTSACTGSCTVIWPPAPADGTPTVSGIDPALVGTVTRVDGSHQLTLDGWPLYRYAPDDKPGDTKGQGVDGTWWAVTPSGARAAAMSDPGSPGGY